MAKYKFTFNSSYANFISELNMRFSEELSVTHENCRDYEHLSDIYDVSTDHTNEVVILTSVSGVQVGATAEVKKLANLLKKKYGIKLKFA